MSAKNNNIMDVSQAGRGVWLVKVPKYISNQWSKMKGTEVGRLRIGTSKPEVVLTLNDDAAKKPEGAAQMPKEYEFGISNVAKQSLVIFSQDSEKVSIEGKVIHKADCRPVANDARYLQLKRQNISEMTKPARCAKPVGLVVNNYKPVSNHKNNVEFERRKKAVGRKQREDKDKVMEMLFAAFEKHQYYNIKDLQVITKQPITYLKEILKDIGHYNMKNPHKNMWELKPEYRHYDAKKTLKS